MSAMRVRGKDCQVKLWGDCFSGWAAGDFHEGDFDHDALVAWGFQNDQVSSLKVWKGGVPDYGSDGCWVELSEHHWD